MSVSLALVTGGAGFLGSHLCDRLVRDGHSVVCLDDLSSGRLANIAHLLKNPQFEFLERDVTQPFRVEADQVYHLASPASPVDYQADPVGTTRTIVLGTMEALACAAACGARLFLASTSEVYGDPEVHPQPESYPGRVSPDSPRACYSEAKRCAETVCFDYQRQHGAASGVSVKVARLFNTYGPRMRPDDGRVVSNFAIQALLGEPLTIHGDGSQTRSFCYVDDIVEGIVKLMATDTAFCGPVNLGNPVEQPIETLATAVVEACESSSARVSSPRPTGDPNRRCPDIGLALKALGWSPAVTLSEGLARTMAWFRTEVASGDIEETGGQIKSRSAVDR